MKYVKIVGYSITVCLTFFVRFSQNLRSSEYLATIIRIVIVNTVERAKTWCHFTEHFTVFLNPRITTGDERYICPSSYKFQPARPNYLKHRSLLKGTLVKIMNRFCFADNIIIRFCFPDNLLQ